MNNLFRGLLSGYGAYKLGGGCLGTVVMFIIIWVLLGKCNWVTRPFRHGADFSAPVSVSSDFVHGGAH